MTHHTDVSSHWTSSKLHPLSLVPREVFSLQLGMKLKRTGKSESKEKTPSMKLSLIVLSFSLCLLLPSTHSTDIKYCGQEDDYAVKVQGVEISPNPVLRGKPVTFAILASTGQTISSGKVVIDVSFFGVPVHRETQDLCEKLSCPISRGDFVLAHTQTLPGFTPPGSYKLKMTIEDDHNQKLSCISFSFRIGFGSSVSAS